MLQCDAGIVSIQQELSTLQQGPRHAGEVWFGRSTGYFLKRAGDMHIALLGLSYMQHKANTQEPVGAQNIANSGTTMGCTRA